MAENRFQKYMKTDTKKEEPSGNRFEKYIKPAKPPQQQASVGGQSSFEQFKDRYNAGIPMPGTNFAPVDDRVRALARGVPIIGGAMDEIGAGLNTGFGLLGDYGKALDEERAKDKKYDTESPVASTGLQIAGGVAGTAAGLKGFGAPPTPGTLPGKVGAGAGTGGLLGAWEAFTRGEGGFENRWEAAKKAAGPSALIGVALPVVGYGIGKIYDAFKKPAASGLTAQTLKNEAAPLFESARQANMAMKPEAYDQFVGEIYKAVDDGLVPENMPKLVASLKALDARRGQPIPYSEIMKLEKVLKSAEGPDNPEQTRLAKLAISKLDELIDGMSPDAIVGDGDPALIREIHNQAKSLWTRGKNAELLDNLIENAKNAVGANYTDAQFQTAIRQQLRGIAKDNFKNYRWLKQPERDAILTVIRGEGLENGLRKMGKYSPLTLGGAARVGGLTYAANTVLPGSGPAVAALLAAGGAVSAPLANQLSKRNTALLGETLLQGQKVFPKEVAEELARLGLIYGAPIAGKSGAPVAGLLGGGGAW